MEGFRKTIKKRITVYTVYCAAVLIVMAFGMLDVINEREGFTGGFISGINMGAFTGIELLVVTSIIRFYRALKDESKLKQLHIAETDERCRFIRAQIGGTGINVIIGGLALGTVAAGYVNETVFFTLCGTLVFAALVKAVLKLIYASKY